MNMTCSTRPKWNVHDSCCTVLWLSAKRQPMNGHHLQSEGGLIQRSFYWGGVGGVGGGGSGMRGLASLSVLKSRITPRPHYAGEI